MKISCILKQAMCLLSLLILTCHSKGSIKRNCSARIIQENVKLLNKTAEFKKLFPDDITNMKLLTTAFKNEFLENCSTRLHLLSFYTKDVLSADIVLPEAEKSGIRDAFLKIEDMLQFCPTKCQQTKSAEEMEGMKDLRNKMKKITEKEGLHKAISEIDTLRSWINSFVSKIKRKGQ